MDDKPVFVTARRLSPVQTDVARAKCEEMKAAGIIVPSTSDRYAAMPTLPLKKDANGEYTDRRFCVDWRLLNKKTIADKYMLHRPEDLFLEARRSDTFSHLDCMSGFMNILLEQESKPYTSFWDVATRSLWQLTRMPFGLKSASAFFQRGMDYEINKAGLQHCCVCFIDDLMVHTMGTAHLGPQSSVCHAQVVHHDGPPRQDHTCCTCPGIPGTRHQPTWTHTG